MNNKIQQLILKYAGAEISYADFRREFASSLVNPGSIDEQQLVYKVESLCADHSEGFLDEEQLRHRLVNLCPIVLESIVHVESAFQAGAANGPTAPVSLKISDSTNDPKILEYAVA